MKVHHFGIDLDSISFSPRQWCPGEPLKVLLAATFREKKGLIYAIEALGQIRNTIPLELIIIGDAGQEPDSQQEKVATTHCDIPEVVGSAFAHLLAPERDVAKLAKCIQSLLNEPDSWSSLMLEGRKHIENEYHQIKQAERLTDHYNEIV